MTKAEIKKYLKELAKRQNSSTNPDYALEEITLIDGKLQLSPAGMMHYLKVTYGSCDIKKEYVRVATQFFYHKDTEFKPVGELQRRHKKEFLRARTIQRAFTALVNFEELLIKVAERDKKKEMESKKSTDLRDVPGTYEHHKKKPDIA